MTDESADIPLARRAVLPYQTPGSGAAKKLRTFHDQLEAQLYANELAAHGIQYFLANGNVVSLGLPYSGFSQIELQVRAEDLDRAKAVLADFQANPMEVEPADPVDPQQPIADPDGNGSLLTAAAFENPGALFDAAASLGAARIECFVPALVDRRVRPAGVGKRFALRVREEDLDRATQVLASADEDDDGEPRCPKCGSYRVTPVEPWSETLRFLLGMRRKSEPKMECLRCKHQWLGTK
jgi:hypothetical protein